MTAVSALHGAVTPRRADPAVLAWQYFDENLPSPGVIVGAFSGSRLIGTQGFIPAAALYGDAPILSAKSELTLVDPEFRGRFVFEGMYEHALMLLTAGGIACIWGFTSAVKPFLRAGFYIHGPLYDEVVVLRPLRFAASHVLQAKPNPVSTDEQADAVAWSQRLRQGTGGVGAFRLLPSPEWLRYRYLHHPFAKVAAYDADNGVLFASDRSSPATVWVAEAAYDADIPCALRRTAVRTGAVLVRRFSNVPALSSLSIRRPVRRKTSAMKIVFRWVQTAGPLPQFHIEQGYKEGV